MIFSQRTQRSGRLISNDRDMLHDAQRPRLHGGAFATSRETRSYESHFRNHHACRCCSRALLPFSSICVVRQSRDQLPLGWCRRCWCCNARLVAASQWPLDRLVCRNTWVLRPHPLPSKVGWFGGMLPLPASPIVTSTGSFDAGLYDPIGVSIVTLVICTLFRRDT